jgi:class 3 adenylate cyclase
VKFIGDGALIVFEEQFAEAGIAALLTLKEQTDAWLREVAPRSRLMVKAHFGPVIAGGFGPTRTFDVIGETVNTTARLAADGFAISAEAFGKLKGEALRQRFRKNTPPITYALHWTAGAEKADPVTEHDATEPE